jgi:hypothetical protein
MKRRNRCWPVVWARQGLDLDWAALPVVWAPAEFRLV